jgi:SapC
MAMTRTVLLNNIDHHALRVITRRDAALGDDVMFAVTFTDEFRSLQAHYPIVFQKTADGVGFQPIALLGFEPQQNLFLGAQGWDAPYVPLAIERQPFFIGRQGDELLMHIDLDSPRISQDDGEPLFLEHGGTTEFLERMNSVLLAIHQGLQGTPAFITALLQHDLLESFVFDVEHADGSQARLAGYYTIHEERLAALRGAALETLQAAGHLHAIYMTLASLSNLRCLVERHNRRAGGPGRPD